MYNPILECKSPVAEVTRYKPVKVTDAKAQSVSYQIRPRWRTVIISFVFGKVFFMYYIKFI